MKILYVCNNAFIPGNGISTSARNIVRHLRDAGQDVRLLSCANPDKTGPQPDFGLKKYHFPFFQHIIDVNGFCYAAIDKDVVREAVLWADVVHIEEPLFLQKAAIKEARRQGKPVTATFHLYTQNILSEIPFANTALVNSILMRLWRRNYFDKCTDIQCPSLTVKELLEKHHFHSRLHVISNGIEIPDTKVTAQPVPADAPVRIISVGRFAVVKNHRLLMEAMRYCRNAGRIQLYFAGMGQLEERYRRMAHKLVKDGILSYEPIFRFHSREELKDLALNSYLYVHTAMLEVEGLGCAEALREGCVPLIARGPLIATSDFALDERSTYDVNSPQELASKIDYWIENPQERNRMSQVYADNARNYDVRRSAAALVEMYEQAVSGRV